MVHEDLNKYRTPNGWLDWAALDNPLQARRGDTLTINHIRDIGPKVAAACKVIDRMIRRGVIVNSSAVCDDPHQLAGQAHLYSEKMRREKAAIRRKETGKVGGRRVTYSDERIAEIHNELVRGLLTRAEMPELYGITEQTMARRCEKLNLQWPITDWGLRSTDLQGSPE